MNSGSTEEVFKKFASSVLEKQIVELRNIYSSKEAIRKYSRLRLFNDHLNILKEHLQTKITVLQKQEDNISMEVITNLQDIYEDCVKEFFKTNFDE